MSREAIYHHMLKGQIYRPSKQSDPLAGAWLVFVLVPLVAVFAYLCIR